MSRTDYELSFCCFKPIARSGGWDTKPSQPGVCSHCGVMAIDSIYWGYAHFTNTVELMVRRFANGDATWEQVKEVIEAIADSSSRNLLRNIQEGLDDGEEPRWKFSIENNKWVKNKP